MSQYIVVYPPQLDLLLEPQGNDFIIGYSPTTGKMVRMSLTTLLSGRSVPVWEPEESYDTDFIVEWNLRFWKSLEDDNEGNIPSENTHWTEVSEDETVTTTTPETLIRTLPKTAHGFAVKNVLTLNGAGVLVKVSDPSTEKRIGIVTEVIDANTFKVAISGYATGLSGLVAGSVYYGQADGTISTVESDMPVLHADSATSGYILSAGSGGGGGMQIAGTYGNIAALLADQANQDEGFWYMVDDASTDATVDAGWAIYEKLAATTGAITDYIKRHEQESLDVPFPDADATTKGKARLYPSTSLGTNTDGAPTQNAVKVYADNINELAEMSFIKSTFIYTQR